MKMMKNLFKVKHKKWNPFSRNRKFTVNLSKKKPMNLKKI